jgi:hypothetical protein
MINYKPFIFWIPWKKDKLPEIKLMETKYFTLGYSESSKLVKIIRIILGLVCVAIAVYWMIFNIRSVKADRTLWITVSFLSGFGLFQVLAGLGRTTRFIQIGIDKIIIKKNSILPHKVIFASDIKKIEIFPLNLIFYHHKGGKTVLRFGTEFTDNIDRIKKGIEEFAAVNNTDLETMTEEI